MPSDAIEIETGPQPTASVIVLHGLGADGRDFVPVAEAFKLDAVGPLRFVFPHAPMRPVTINGGQVMRAWYDLFDMGLVRREDESGLRASQALVDALVARERRRGVAALRIVLAGFSQGCAMTLMTGLRHPERLAGLLCMSGYLPLAARLAAERHPINADVPIFMAHGSADPVIPIARAQASRDALLAMGYPLEWHEYAMQHSVHPQEISDMNAWLLRVLA